MDLRETIIDYVIDTYSLNKDRDVVAKHVDEWLDCRQQVNSVDLADVVLSEERTEKWNRVVFASDCLYEEWDIDREMPICKNCKIEYAECSCPGPTQDDIYEYNEVKGELYARLKENKE